jgi:hypothetical protein
MKQGMNPGDMLRMGEREGNSNDVFHPATDGTYNIKRLLNIIGLDRLKLAVLTMERVMAPGCPSVQDSFVKNNCRFFLKVFYLLKRKEGFMITAYSLLLAFLFFSLTTATLLGQGHGIQRTLPLEVWQEQRQVSTPSLVEQAYVKGEISIDQRVLYHTYAIFEPVKVPEQYRSPFPEKCGTWILDEILRNWEKLTPETKHILETYGFRPPGILQRPTGLDSSRSTIHFKIHYSVDPGDSNAISPIDANGNGTPDYVDDVMNVLEIVWQTEVNVMGYVAPPPDGNSGGDSLYDVYLMKIGSNIYGYTTPEKLVRDNPYSPGVTERNAATSYVVMQNNYQSFLRDDAQNIRHTSAHEFFHAIQNGYDFWEKFWLKEATAAWSEDEVFDEINQNYDHLAPWFATPWIPLDADHRTEDSLLTYEGHWYGSMIFFRYISEHVGGRNTVRRIWEHSVKYDSRGGDFSFSAIRDALAEQGTDFERVFQNFVVANLFRTIPPYNYEEGAEYPEVGIEASLFGDKTIERPLPRRASDYVRVSPNLLPRGADIINFTFTPLDSNTRFGVQVVTRSGNTVRVNSFATNFSLAGTQDMDEIVVIVMNFDTLGTTNRYRLRVQTNSALHRISWNPVRYRGGQTLTLTNGLMSWEGLDGKGYLYYDSKFWPLGGDGEWPMRAVLHNGRAAWLDLKWWDVAASTVVVRYFDGTNVRTVGSRNWTVFLDRLGVFPGHTLAIYGQRIAIPIRFLRNPPFESNDDEVALCISMNGADPVPITPYFKVADYYGVHVHQLNRSDVIWSLKPYAPSPDTVFWYRNGSNELPPTRFRNTIPKLDNGRLAWTESKSDDQVVSDSTFEMFYFDGITTRQLTNDNVRDAGYYDDFDLDGWLANGRIAWLRYSEKPWWGGGLFIAYYDGSGIKFLADTLNFVPRADHIVKIDPIKGLVAWYGYGGNPPSFDPLNIWLYDGVGIQPIVPPTLQIAAEAMAINDGQIAFAAWPQQGDDLAIYLYTHERSITSVTDRENVLSEQCTLFQNYPNPFNSMTTIRFSLLNTEFVTLKVFDVLGNEIATLVNGEMSAGEHSVVFDARELSTGIYFYQLRTSSSIQKKIMALTK